MPPDQLMHCDINNAYYNMATLFQPKLRNRAVVVLGSGQTNVIARSPEAKALGIKMSEPWFKVKERLKGHDIVAVGANMAFIGDMSRRFTNLIRQYSPMVEWYSVDEVWLDLAGFNRINFTDYGQRIRSEIFKSLNLPLSIGIAPTKTLTKLATYCAKQEKHYNGVCDFSSMSTKQLDLIFKSTPLEEIWGIGKQLSAQLNAEGLYSVYDLKISNMEVMRRKYSLTMAKTINELNGHSCISLELISQPKKQILRSRSFGRPVKTLEDLSQSISVHTSRAAEKLREQNSAAGLMTVFISTSRYIEYEDRYSNSYTIPIPGQTSNTLALVRIALYALKRIFKDGYNYSKSGVMFSQLVPSAQCQNDMFSHTISDSKSDTLMQTIDNINKRMGKNTIRVATAGFDQTWQPKSDIQFPSYTTQWDELLAVD